jgi:hypothetical protein
MKYVIRQNEDFLHMEGGLCSGAMLDTRSGLIFDSYREALEMVSEIKRDYGLENINILEC